MTTSTIRILFVWNQSKTIMEKKSVGESKTNANILMENTDNVVLLKNKDPSPVCVRTDWLSRGIVHRKR